MSTVAKHKIITVHIRPK